MNILASVIAYVQTHWTDLLAIITQVIGVASIIVRFTPTLRDDDVLKGVIRFVGKYIALNRSGDSSPKP